MTKLVTILTGSGALLILIGAVVTASQLTKEPGSASTLKNTAYRPDISQNQITNDPFAIAASLPSCKKQQQLLDLPPLNRADFEYIVPLGLLTASGHTVPTPHIYFKVRPDNPADRRSDPAEVPIVAPGDMIINEISFAEAPDFPEFSDSRVNFGLCNEVVGYLDHFKTLSPKLKQAYDAGETIQCNDYTVNFSGGPVDWHLCTKRVNLTIAAGESLGTAGGGTGQRFLDLGLFDQRVEPDVPASPSQWSSRQSWLQTVCPLDYFPASLRSALYPLLGGASHEGGQRTAEPTCGEVNQDIAGTAQGTWLAPGYDRIGHEDPHLTLAHHWVDPSQGIFAVGSSVKDQGLPQEVYSFTPQASGLVNRDFPAITSNGQTYCFETKPKNLNSTQTILVTMPTATTLSIGPGPIGACDSGPWQLSKSVTFSR